MEVCLVPWTLTELPRQAIVPFWKRIFCVTITSKNILIRKFESKIFTFLKFLSPLLSTWRMMKRTIFYRSMRVCSFECIEWKKLDNYFVVWKLEHAPNLFIGWFFIWLCAVHPFNFMTSAVRLTSYPTKIVSVRVSQETCSKSECSAENIFHRIWGWGQIQTTLKEK